MNGSRIAIVGGGLAGLAAAIDCADAGAAVTLYEGRTRLGGATFSFRRNGLWLDNGQHVSLRCCTSYTAFLRRIGSAELLTYQSRLRVPVLREGRRPAFISRTGLPAPLHLSSTLVRYSPLSPVERAAAVRGALALRRLDPADPALDRQTFGSWLESHGQSANAIASLWNLIALPTLNLPAGEASLAAAVKVFRTGLLDSAEACDIGIPSVPFERLHAQPAAAALERAGGRIIGGTPVRAVTPDLKLLLDDGADEADAVIVTRRSPASCRRPRWTSTAWRASARARSSTSISTTTGRCSTSPSRRRSDRRCSGSSTAPRRLEPARARLSPSRSRMRPTRSAPR